ncbi:PAS domain S-box protein [Parasediminibacterium paludis]|uniref:PAS domain S-box protein n=1 Tax=Parasediminibacterium paludis TaxID=908966 RepID=A0ABV8PSA5_9BACT
MPPEIPIRKFDFISFSIDCNLKICDIAQETAAALGYASVSIINKSINAFINPNHQHLFLEAIELLNSSSTTIETTLELQLVLASKEMYWFSLELCKQYTSTTNHHFKISATNIQAFKLREANLILQIAEKNKALEALQSTYQINEAIVNNANAIIITVDVDNKISSISKFTEALIGFTIDEIKGKDALDVLLPKQLYPEYHQYVIDLRKKGPLPNPFEGLLRTKNGEERIISWMSNPLILNGENIGRVSIGKDITEVKTKEQALIDRENRFRRIAENIPLPVAICNKEGQTAFLNKQLFEVIGYTIDEIPTIFDAYKYVKYTNPGLVEKEQKEWEHLFTLFSKGQVVSFPVLERIVICKDGAQKHFEISFSLEDNMLYLIFNDVTTKVLYSRKLKQQKDFYETILNNIPSDIAVFDSNHRYLFVNPVAVKDKALRQWLIGKTDEDYCILKNKPLSISEDRRKLFNEVKENKALKNWEEKLIKPDGTVEYHLRKLYPVLNDEGGIELAIGYAVNITDLKQAQNSLIESEQRFKRIADNTPIPICNFDKDMNITYINKKFLDTVGYSFEDVAKADAWPHFIYYPDAASTEKGREEWLKAIENKWHNPKSKTPVLERTIICKNGEHKVFEISFTVNNKLVYAILNEVTERKKAQTLLFESEQRFKALAENMPIAIGSHHIDGEVVFLNKFFVETIGYTTEDIPTLKEWYLRTQPNADTREKLYSHWLETVAAYRRGELQHVPDIETSILCKNGIIKTFSFLFSIYKDVVYIMLVDITERKKAEKELLESHTQLRELASHLQKVREEERKYIAREIHDELGQLVTGLKMDISITKKKVEKITPELGEKLTTIMEVTDEIIHTVRRIASELRPSILDDIGLDAALEWQAKEFEKRTNITCVFVNNARDIVVSMDVKSNLFRIFQESLTNIIRHANATIVKASLVTQENSLIFTITDNGDGFKTENTGRTFGLLGMKERVIMINGIFEIESQSGRGTQIVIKIPLV